MRVFVAGGAGVIGRRLIPGLIGAGHEVIAGTRPPGRGGPSDLDGRVAARPGGKAA